MSAEVLKISLYQNNVPVELRKIVFCYYRQDIDDNNIHNAVKLWCWDKNTCLMVYDHISDWDTSKVTNMNYLFSCREFFNDDVSKWNTSNVVTMESMFSSAASFNQDLHLWDVSNPMSPTCIACFMTLNPSMALSMVGIPVK